MSVAAGWFGGGTAKGADFGAPKAIGFGFLTLLIIILLERLGRQPSSASRSCSASSQER